MGNDVSTENLKFNTKDSINEKNTAQSDANHVFEDLQELESQSYRDGKFSKFLVSNFKQKKIASKKIQFKIINKNDSNIKSHNYGRQQSNSDSEKTSQSSNKNSNTQNEIQNIPKTVSEKQEFLGIDTLSNSLIYKTDGNLLKQNLTLNKDFYSTLDTKYKQLCITQQKFVKLKRHDFKASYEIIEKIGEGTTGNVFSAKCKKTGQLRAVKVLKSNILVKPSLRKFFKSELQIAKNFDHPNIVKIFDVFHTNGTYYIVTECCTGGTLENFALKCENVDFMLLKVVFKQIFSALNYLHAQSIIHRDIKMDNVVFVSDPLLCKNVNDIKIKIIDFGLSKKTKFKAINKDTPCLGTPLYMAPEIMKGHYSEKSDIWACGVIMHFLLFKEYPFESQQIEEIFKKISSQQIDFSKHFWTKIPNDLLSILQGMLQKNPVRRLSAQQAINSQWLSELKLEEPKREQKDAIYYKLASYKKENNFISLIESFALFSKSSSQFSPEDLKAIRLFQKIDANHNGFIEINELEQVLQENIGNEVGKRFQIRQMLAKIDKNNSGMIELSEFLSLFVDRKELFSEECLGRAFDFLDNKKCGYISRRDLLRLLEGCEDTEFEKLWRDLDSNGDGQVSRQQFTTYFQSLQYTPDKQQKSPLLVQLDQ